MIINVDMYMYCLSLSISGSNSQRAFKESFDPTPDMNPDTLNALSALMVAQAQETIYRKCASGEILT
jgi:hypothetical protein